MLPKTFSPSPQQGAASPELGPGATVAAEVQPAQNEYTLIIDRKEEKELLYRGGYKDVRDGNVHSYSNLEELGHVHCHSTTRFWHCGFQSFEAHKTFLERIRCLEGVRFSVNNYVMERLFTLMPLYTRNHKFGPKKKEKQHTADVVKKKGFFFLVFGVIF